MATKKTKIIDGTTKIGADIIGSMTGGDSGAAINDPQFGGHQHSLEPNVGAYGNFGQVAKIDLTNHTTGRLTLSTANSVLKCATITGAAGIPTSFTTGAGTIYGTIFYFAMPADIDISQDSFFAIQWMGQENVPSGISKNISFRYTYQWYLQGSSVFPPSVMFDAYGSSAPPNLNIIQNSQTRGRSQLNMAQKSFQLAVNDSVSPATLGATSFSGGANYFRLSGLTAATNSSLLGVQVDTLVSQFNSVQIFQAQWYYASKTMGAGLNTLPSF